MPLTKTEKNMLAVGGIVLIGALAFGAGAAVAEEPRRRRRRPFDPGAGEEEDDPDIPDVDEPITPVPAGVQIFDPDLFVGSPKDCNRTGNNFNLAQWPNTIPEGPSRVAEAMTALGFPITPEEILQGDKVRGKQFRIWDGPVVPKRSDTVRLFQAVARSRALPGHINAPASAVDGIMGECSLESLTAAVKRFNEGNWPPV